ncbi:MAG TPA: hypothetical protein VJ801_08550 [Polyangia bacterium]|jgi:hypothetical protein|nr:hypothetical protein [Polyangia bacterium]
MKSELAGLKWFALASVAAAFNAGAIQDIWEFSGCICNTPEIAEESGTAGGNTKVALQA